MTQVNLTLPLSATALREGAEFLTKLSQLAEVIRAEANPTRSTEAGQLHMAVSCDTSKLQEQLAEGGELEQAVFSSLNFDHQTTVEDDVATAEQATVITQETLPPVEYETIVTGYKRNPEYAGANAAFDQAALEAAGWTVELLLADGYLIEVTEQRPKAVAPGASAAPSPAPTPSAAPAPPVPDTSADLYSGVDADGLPWDERIHSKAAEPKAATGKWKTRKNLAPGYKEQIEAQLRAVSDTTASPSAPAPTPAAPSAPVVPAPVPAPGAAPAAPATGNPFAEFTAWMMPQVKSGKLDQSKITLAVQKAGLTTAADLSKQPELCAQVKADLIATYSL